MNQPNSAEVTKEEVTDPSEMTNEQLTAALETASSQPVEETEETVAAPEEFQTEKEPKEVAVTDPPAQETEAPATEEEPGDFVAEGLPFKSADELAKGYKNLMGLVESHNQELGELRKRVREEKVQTPQTPSIMSAPKQPQQFVTAGEADYDPDDKQAVDAYIKRQVQAGISQAVTPLQAQVQQILSKETARESNSLENNFRLQAEKLMADHPEYKISGKLPDVLGLVDSCADKGVDPITVNPDAAKAIYLRELTNMVIKSNGFIKDLNHAHRIRLTEGDGLDKMIENAKRKSTIETVEHINEKGRTAKTISKAGGAAPKRTIKDLSWEELTEVGAKVSGQEEKDFADRLFKSF